MRKSGPRGLELGCSACRCLSICPPISLSLISCSYPLPTTCWPNSVVFIGPDFTSSHHSRSEERNSFDAESAYRSQRMTLAQLASSAYSLDQSQLPRGQDAMTGSHAYSCWGPEPDTVPRVWPPVWPGVWGKNSFPEEELLSEQKEHVSFTGLIVFPQIDFPF